MPEPQDLGGHTGEVTFTTGPDGQPVPHWPDAPTPDSAVTSFDVTVRFADDCGKHLLTRMPIIQAQVDYHCRKCGGAASVILQGQMWANSLDDIDTMASYYLGGQVIAFKVPEPTHTVVRRDLTSS